MYMFMYKYISTAPTPELKIKNTYKDIKNSEKQKKPLKTTETPKTSPAQTLRKGILAARTKMGRGFHKSQRKFITSTTLNS